MGVVVESDIGARLPQVRGGAPSSLGEGLGASSTKEYPLTLGVSTAPKRDSDGSGRGFPDIAS